MVIAYDLDSHADCGALKKYSGKTAEIKQMNVPVEKRRRGIATLILKELETWAPEMNFEKCILETAKRQPEAIRMYKKNKYRTIPYCGQYKNVGSRFCFEKIFCD